MRDVVGFVFARGGSKGLPGKNIKNFCGKPLIAWSIEQAIATPGVRRVIVSTDCYEIADVAIRFGAEVPFIRPKELSGDSAPEWLAWQHALYWLEQDEGALPDAMLSVPATSPLRLGKDLESCVQKFFLGAADAVVTITEASRNPYFNMVTVDCDGRLGVASSGSAGVFRRQDAPEVFDLTTVAYVISPRFVLNNDSIFDGRVEAVHIPKDRAIDIDTELDFKIAEFVYSLSKGN